MNIIIKQILLVILIKRASTLLQHGFHCFGWLLTSSSLCLLYKLCTVHKVWRVVTTPWSHKPDMSAYKCHAPHLSCHIFSTATTETHSHTHTIPTPQHKSTLQWRPAQLFPPVAFEYSNGLFLLVPFEILLLIIYVSVIDLLLQIRQHTLIHTSATFPSPSHFSIHTETGKHEQRQSKVSCLFVFLSRTHTQTHLTLLPLSSVR